MLPNPNADLTDEQLEQLKLAEEAIPKIRKAIEKAKLAGIDVTAEEAKLNEQQQAITKLLRVYSGTPASSR